MKTKVFCQVVFALVLPAFAVTTFAQTTETHVVTPVNPQGWGFLAEGASGKSGGEFVNGPAGAPLGTGSAMLTTADATGGHILATARYGGVKLSDISELKYNGIGNSTPQAIALQFDVDSDVTDGNTVYQGRLVFEPYQSYGNAAVVPNVWTEWDTLNGRWWGSGSGPSRPVSNYCPQSAPCTTAQLLAVFPNVGIREPGALLFKAGSGWASPFSGNVDKLVIGINGSEGVTIAVWDFELYSTPGDPDQCKKGGYLLFNPPAGPYKNQGECVSSVVSNAGG